MFPVLRSHDRDCLPVAQLRRFLIRQGQRRDAVQRGLDRVREARKLGFKRALLPRSNLPKDPPEEIELIAPRRIEDILELFDR